MRKILYITASPKPENQSTSKQVGRRFVDSLLERCPDCTVDELDLVATDIPELSPLYFKGWVELVSGPEYDSLTMQDKEAVDKINSLCNQFLLADIYVIAAPMWGLSFPSRLKQYFDCIMLNGKLIRLTPQKAEGLLGGKPRQMVYIQSSGGIYPKMVDFKFNYGVNYTHDIFKRLGVKCFSKILVQGTDMVDVGKDKAIAEAQEDFDCALNKASTLQKEVAAAIYP